MRVRIILALFACVAFGAIAVSGASADWAGDAAGNPPTCNNGSDGQWAHADDLLLSGGQGQLTAVMDWTQHCHHAQSVEIEAQVSGDGGKHWVDTVGCGTSSCPDNDFLIGTSTAQADTTVSKSYSTVIFCTSASVEYRLKVWFANQSSSATIPVVSTASGC